MLPSHDAIGAATEQSPDAQTAYNGTGQPAPGETWTGFSLQFTGATCPADLLSYGQQGVLGAGPAAAYNGPSVAISGVTPNVSSS